MRPYTIARFTILYVSAFLLSLPSKLTNCPTRSILASTISELLTGARTMLRASPSKGHRKGPLQAGGQAQSCKIAPHLFGKISSLGAGSGDPPAYKKVVTRHNLVIGASGLNLNEQPLVLWLAKRRKWHGGCFILFSQSVLRGSKMSRQIDTAFQRAKHKRETKSAPSFGTLARLYFDLQRLRQEVRIAECGKAAGPEWLLDNHGAAADWSTPGACPLVQH
jgi:hypothetical protein